MACVAGGALLSQQVLPSSLYYYHTMCNPSHHTFFSAAAATAIMTDEEPAVPSLFAGATAASAAYRRDKRGLSEACPFSAEHHDGPQRKVARRRDGPGTSTASSAPVTGVSGLCVLPNFVSHTEGRELLQHALFLRLRSAPPSPPQEEDSTFTRIRERLVERRVFPRQPELKNILLSCEDDLTPAPAPAPALVSVQASVCLGAPYSMHLVHRPTRRTVSLTVPARSLLVLSGEALSEWTRTMVALPTAAAAGAASKTTTATTTTAGSRQRRVLTYYLVSDDAVATAPPGEATAAAAAEAGEEDADADILAIVSAMEAQLAVHDTSAEATGQS